MTMQAPSRDNAGVIAPPPAIAGLTVLLGLALDWLAPAYILTVLLSPATRVVLGLACVGGGAWLALMALRTFKAVGTNAAPGMPTLALATGAPYTWLRNPMYLATGLVVAGIGFLLASDWTIVLLVPAALVMHFGVVLREERYLEAKFGDDYRRYKAKVSRYGWPI
jgi:protein-S-isoprenylcysteine O-methyltransferase Ste14